MTQRINQATSLVSSWSVRCMTEMSWWVMQVTWQKYHQQNTPKQTLTLNTCNPRSKLKSNLYSFEFIESFYEGRLSNYRFYVSCISSKIHSFWHESFIIDIGKMMESDTSVSPTNQQKLSSNWSFHSKIWCILYVDQIVVPLGYGCISIPSWGLKPYSYMGNRAHKEIEVREERHNREATK